MKQAPLLLASPVATLGSSFGNSTEQLVAVSLGSLTLSSPLKFKKVSQQHLMSNNFID